MWILRGLDKENMEAGIDGKDTELHFHEPAKLPIIDSY